jgi:hypothetical protein
MFLTQQFGRVGLTDSATPSKTTISGITGIPTLAGMNRFITGVLPDARNPRNGQVVNPASQLRRGLQVVTTNKASGRFKIPSIAIHVSAARTCHRHHYPIAH